MLATFSANNHPIEAVEFQGRNRTNKGLARSETNGSWHLREVTRAERISIILDRHAQPDVVGPWKLIGNRRRALRTLGENLVRMLRRAHHDIEDSFDELERHALMK